MKEQGRLLSIVPAPDLYGDTVAVASVLMDDGRQIEVPLGQKATITIAEGLLDRLSWFLTRRGVA